MLRRWQIADRIDCLFPTVRVRAAKLERAVSTVAFHAAPAFTPHAAIGLPGQVMASAKLVD
jgi:hypothetical protein